MFELLNVMSFVTIAALLKKLYLLLSYRMSRMETFYNQFDSKKQTNVRVKNNLTVYMYMHIKCLQGKK